MTITVTHWLVILATESENTPSNRQAYGDIYANNGSGESAANEANGLNTALKLQRVINPGVVFARVLKAPMDTTIRPLLKDFCLNTFSGNRMFIEVEFGTNDLLRLYQVLGAVTTDITDFTGTFWDGLLFNKTNLLAYLLATFQVEPYENGS